MLPRSQRFLRSVHLLKTLLVLFPVVTSCFGIFVQEELKNVTKAYKSPVSPVKWTDPLEAGLWGPLLEDWTLSNNYPPTRGREARIIQTVAAPQFNSNYQHAPSHQKYIPTSEAYLTRRTGELNEGESMAKAGTNIPTYNEQQTLKLKLQRQNQFNSPREVSETDLYLLGAIEKLVYRVDYMEKRMKRTEQLVYYLMSGNNQKPKIEPCVADFTRIGDTCYHFGLSEQVDWKTANIKCNILGATLAEMETVEKFQDVVAYILGNQKQRSHNFWIGGLNPGLLWIWSTSAKPVNPFANITSFTNKTETINKVPVKAINQVNSKNETILSTGFPEITGDGRCLRLSYNQSQFTYKYTGHDCSTKNSFMCILQDKTLDNEIKRIAKELKFDI